MVMTTKTRKVKNGLRKPISTYRSIDAIEEVSIGQGVGERHQIGSYEECQSFKRQNSSSQSSPI